MNVIDFADSDLGPYFAARRRLIASGLRRGYHLGNTRICWGCDGEVDPVDLSCSCFAPTRKKARMADQPDTDTDDTPMTVEEAEELFRAMGVEIRDDITIH